MLSIDDRTVMAELLFPHIGTSESEGDTDYYEKKYPPRELPVGAAVTRLGPSPTGFIHLGNLYTAFMNEKLANETGGVCYLRIEDTDSKREVEGAVESLIASLSHFGVGFDEGVALTDAGDIVESGAYGPYYQSERVIIYQTYARKLVLNGLAYPCFFTESEINALREEQEGRRETPGVYGTYAKYRDISPEEAQSRVKRGERYVLRVDADAMAASAPDAGDAQAEIIDGIRGKLSFPRNIMDVVVLKSDGVPTYHFAHVIDDHLMRTTHVIRGEEWISSLPIHAALFGALGFEPPIYCHSTVLMKRDDGKKRKLSKRKDPELSLEYYRSEGYHPKAILEYLLTIINSNFEEWRAAHPEAPIDNFEMTPEKMGVSGILFDLDKLRDVSKEVLARMPAGEIADFVLKWSAMYDHRAHEAMVGDKQRLDAIIDIGRTGEKPRKDLAYAKQIWDFISYFYDEFYEVTDPWPDNVSDEDARNILTAYTDGYDHTDDRNEWFGKIRDIATSLGYAAKPKDFKKEPDKYKGHVGDVSAVIRISVVGRAMSPDLYEIQQILGEDKTRSRIQRCLSSIASSPAT
ncbi:MAG: glutamate--tRNA ligase [Clostridiales Family XIII bacterium]|jgi:glutamyl-tRNA synthetase|nr:glutamate--tRNA ligase [Clostridiales Family XIII bacterium]